MPPWLQLRTTGEPTVLPTLNPATCRGGVRDQNSFPGSTTFSPLDIQVKACDREQSPLGCQVKKTAIPILQGTLDLMILRALATMGPQHAYGLAARLEQVSGELINLNQGTIYPALVRLEQRGWTKGSWSKTESNREARFYTITRAGQKALEAETQRWRQMSAVVEKLLAEEPQS